MNRKELLLEAARFIETEAEILKESETLPDGSWPYPSIKEEYDRELMLSSGLYELAEQT